MGHSPAGMPALPGWQMQSPDVIAVPLASLAGKKNRARRFAGAVALGPSNYFLSLGGAGLVGGFDSAAALIFSSRISKFASFSSFSK